MRFMKSAPLKLLNLSLVTAWLLLAGNAAANEEVEERIKKSFSVGTGGMLTVTADRGAIEVVTTATGQVEIEVIRKAGASSREQAKDVLAHHEITFTPRDKDVEVTARRTDDSTGLWDQLGGPSMAGDGTTQLSIASPVDFSADTVEPPTAAPQLGSDTQAVLRELGVADDELARLREAGVIA